MNYYFWNSFDGGWWIYKNLVYASLYRNQMRFLLKHYPNYHFWRAQKQVLMSMKSDLRVVRYRLNATYCPLVKVSGGSCLAQHRLIADCCANCIVKFLHFKLIHNDTVQKHSYASFSLADQVIFLLYLIALRQNFFKKTALNDILLLLKNVH